MTAAAERTTIEVDTNLPSGWHLHGVEVVIKMKCDHCGFVTSRPALNAQCDHCKPEDRLVLGGKLYQEAMEEDHQRWRERYELQQRYPLPPRGEPWPDDHPLHPFRDMIDRFGVASASVPKEARQLPEAAWLRSGLVYYIRLGNRCKIGFSTSLLSRLSALGAEEVLAVEPGSLTLEKQRHREFSDLRTRGEWFRLEDRLTEHCSHLRAEHDLYKLLMQRIDQQPSIIAISQEETCSTPSPS